MKRRGFLSFLAGGVAGATGAVEGIAAVIPKAASKPVLLARGGITATKLAGGAVTAQALNVTSLSAASAVLGNVDIESAVIGVLQVGESNIHLGST